MVKHMLNICTLKIFLPDSVFNILIDNVLPEISAWETTILWEEEDLTKMNACLVLEPEHVNFSGPSFKNQEAI